MLHLRSPEHCVYFLGIIQCFYESTILYLKISALLSETLDIPEAQQSLIIQSPDPPFVSCWTETAAEVLINASARKQT